MQALPKRLYMIALFAVGLVCASCQKDSFKVYAWLGYHAGDDEQQLANYFQKAAEAGIDGILIECHGGYPEILQDSCSFRDSAALNLLRRSAVYAEQYGIELHAWMWSTNRCELNLRQAHPDWYQVNGLGESLTEYKMYGREHYRFLCPSHEEVTEYLKDRVRELAEVDGLTGIHLDFIRYPDAILPYGLHESRGVVQDKVYPTWDCCYCDNCRSLYKEKTGIDPLELEDPESNQEWLQFRLDNMAKMSSEVLAEIRKCGKVSSAAVFATPEESKKLVRQDWVNYRNADCFFPMIYHRSYGMPDEWVETATREGLEGLKANNNNAILYPGIMMPKAEQIPMFVDMAKKAGAKGICFFSLDATKKRPELWDAIAAIDRSL